LRILYLCEEHTNERVKRNQALNVRPVALGCIEECDDEQDGTIGPFRLATKIVLVTD
jgi:hypothetical protein